MSTSDGEFSDRDKLKTLLWSDRHCCLCGKQCGINIEVHHIIPKQKGIDEGIDVSSIDNAIPLCYDCHGIVESYNIKHPKGKNFSVDELKIRRNQIYEKYTQYLVPPIIYKITQKVNEKEKRDFPNVGFNIWHLADNNPVRVYVALDVFLGKKNLGLIQSTNRIYCGEKPFQLNPRDGCNGNFNLPNKVTDSQDPLEIRVNVKIEDIYERIHHLYPLGYVYMWEDNDWFFEPSSALHIGGEDYKLKGWDKPGIL